MDTPTDTNDEAARQLRETLQRCFKRAAEQFEEAAEGLVADAEEMRLAADAVRRWAQ